jgi:hypothetical protein
MAGLLIPKTYPTRMRATSAGQNEGNHQLGFAGPAGRRSGFKPAKEYEVDSTMVTLQNAAKVYDQSSLEGIQ